MPVDYPLLYTFHFYLFGVIAVASALAFVTRRSPIAAALWLVNVMFCLAALYVMMDAHFIGAIQVLVYTGAIMVVFVFVIMLLNLGEADGAGDFRARSTRLAALVVGLALAGETLLLVQAPLPQLPGGDMPDNVVAPVAKALFTEYLLAFEITSVLLLVAIIGAVTLAKRGAKA